MRGLLSHHALLRLPVLRISLSTGPGGCAQRQEESLSPVPLLFLWTPLVAQSLVVESSTLEFKLTANCLQWRKSVMLDFTSRNFSFSVQKTGIIMHRSLEQWCSTFLMMLPFNRVHVVVTLSIKL